MTNNKNCGNRFIAADFISLSAILAIAAVLRFYDLGRKSFWLDEVAAINHSTNSLANLLLFRGSQWYLFWQNLSLHFAGYFGDSEFAYRIPSAIFGVAAVGLFFKYLRSAYGRSEAIIGSFLLALLPGFLMHSQDAKPYPIFVFTTIALFLALDRFSKKENFASAILIILATGAGILAHPFALYLLPPVAVALLIKIAPYRRQIIKAGLAYKLIGALIAIGLGALIAPFANVFVERLIKGEMNQRIYFLWSDIDFFSVTFNYFTSGLWQPLGSAAKHPAVWLAAIGVAGSFLPGTKKAPLARDHFFFWSCLLLSFALVTRVMTVPRYLIFLLVPGIAIWSAGAVGLARTLAGLIRKISRLPNSLTVDRITKALLSAELVLLLALLWPAVADHYNEGLHLQQFKGDWKRLAKEFREYQTPGDLFFLVGNRQAMPLVEHYLPDIVNSFVYRPVRSYEGILNEAGKNRRSFIVFSEKHDWLKFIDFNQDKFAYSPLWTFNGWRMVVLDPKRSTDEFIEHSISRVEPDKPATRNAEDYSSFTLRAPAPMIHRGRAAVELSVGASLEYRFYLPADGRYRISVAGAKISENTPVWLSVKSRGISLPPLPFESYGYQSNSAQFEARKGQKSFWLTVGRPGFIGEQGLIALDKITVEQIDK